MLFGLLEVALPSISEAKRAWTLIQLLIRPRGRHALMRCVKPLKPQLGHTFAGGLEAWSHRVTATVRERVIECYYVNCPTLYVSLEVAQTALS